MSKNEERHFMDDDPGDSPQASDTIRRLASFWSAVSYYIAAKDNAEEMRKRFWAVQYAMDTQLSRECSQRERARRLGMKSDYSLLTRKADALLCIRALSSK